VISLFPCNLPPHPFYKIIPPAQKTQRQSDKRRTHSLIGICLTSEAAKKGVLCEAFWLSPNGAIRPEKKRANQWPNVFTFSSWSRSKPRFKFSSLLDCSTGRFAIPNSSPSLNREFGCLYGNL